LVGINWKLYLSSTKQKSEGEDEVKEHNDKEASKAKK
jgi:hypothetical protein